MEGDFFDAMPKSFGQNNEAQPYIKFIGTLRGIKDKVHNAHWASENMSIHTELDSLFNHIGDFIDPFSEVTQAIYGQFSVNSVCNIPCDMEKPMELVEACLSATTVMETLLGDESIKNGLRSLMDQFILDLQIIKYRLMLCK